MDRVHCFPLYTVGPGWTRWAHILLWIGSNPIYGTVYVAQLVRVLGCDSRGRGFNSHHTPKYALVVELVDTAVLEAVALRLRVRVSPEVQIVRRRLVRSTSPRLSNRLS